MSGLSGALNNAQRSLSSFSQALETIQTNIANASTPAYARQRPALAPIVYPDGTGSGVELTRIESLRNRLLDLQVLAAHQDEGRLSALSTFFQSSEPIFRLNSDRGIDRALDSFFSAAAELSANPADVALRSSLISAADATAGAFRQTREELAAQQDGLDGSVRTSVARINTLLSEIAGLERQRSQQDPRAPNSAIDTRSQQALEELSSLLGIDVQRQRDGTLAVVSASTALLTGVFAKPLQVSLANDSIRVFSADGKNVAESLQQQGGALGGALEARNGVIPSLVADLHKLAKRFADSVNEQLAQGVDLNGAPGAALFRYGDTAVTGSGRSAGLAGVATPTPPQVRVDFSGPFTVSITASLESFAAGSTPPGAPSPGDLVSLRLISADGTIDRTLTTAPLVGGETTAELATRINDQIALDPDLAGLVSVSDAGGNLKLALSDQVGQGFSFEISTAGSGFVTGLEPGGALGGQSAKEIAAALNAEVANQPELVAVGVRFSAQGGELRLDADVAFDFTVTDSDSSATGFASGLGGVSGSAGGLGASGTLETTGIRPVQIAAAQPDLPSGNQNLNAIVALADADLVDGATFNSFFSRIVSDFGGAASETYSRLDTQQQITVTAENLRDNFAGVDLNEEAIQLLHFEEGYQAMLRVIQVVNQLSDDLLNLVR